MATPQRETARLTRRWRPIAVTSGNKKPCLTQQQGAPTPIKVAIIEDRARFARPRPPIKGQQGIAAQHFGSMEEALANA